MQKAMRLDSHQHFWMFSEQEYDWINEDMQVLKRDFLPPDLLEQLKTVDFDASIVVQARQVYQETDWLLKLARDNDFIKGVVGWVDLCDGNVRSHLETYSQHPKLVGVRHVIHDEPDDRFILREDFNRGISFLKEFNLTYDILIFERHLPYAIEFVEKFPDQPFVIDHIAKPLIKDGILEPWAENIKKIAAYPNVFCKLSGMVTEADWNNWTFANLAPYLDLVFESFGTNRLMIGSDWPVCLVAADYKQVIRIVQDYIKTLAEHEQTAILGKNAQTFYNIPL
jgi:L-fuconolactonase